MAAHEEKAQWELEGEPPPQGVQSAAKRQIFGTVRVSAWHEQLDEREQRQAPTSIPPPGSPARPDGRAHALGSASPNGGDVKIRLQFDVAPSRRDVRASDEDRERAAMSLREHFAAGRLEEPELERRVDRAYAAHSRRELAELLSDLPSDGLGRAAMRFYRGQRTALTYHALAYLTLNGSLVGVWELTGHGRFWPGIVIVPTSGVLALHATTSRWLRRKLRI